MMERWMPWFLTAYGVVFTVLHFVYRYTTFFQASNIGLYALLSAAGAACCQLTPCCDVTRCACAAPVCGGDPDLLLPPVLPRVE